MTSRVGVPSLVWGKLEVLAAQPAAGDVTDAVELIAGNWNTWFNAGRLPTVEAWLDRLPMPAQRADPRLCAARAWLLLDAGCLDEVDAGWAPLTSPPIRTMR